MSKIKSDSWNLLYNKVCMVGSLHSLFTFVLNFALAHCPRRHCRFDRLVTMSDKARTPRCGEGTEVKTHRAMGLSGNHLYRDPRPAKQRTIGQCSFLYNSRAGMAGWHHGR
ncbi:hypothetical protein PoB_006382800 [Plakobranchus ocellatus]|uniref:Secreted protein n=1 Tax=Plakobranchus ocellatus TaxID=259542 RepID=A0AAV4CZL1_9GAST|nr:hypothetical protein PoB_006382800 [Plakobranchus ocellatus]